MCRVLQVSRSGYYAWLPLSKSLEDKRKSLSQAILESWVESYKLYGSRRIVKDLRQERSICVSRKRVLFQMRCLGIRSAYQSKKFRKCYRSGGRTSYPGNVLDREFNPSQPNQVWGSDTTFIMSRGGWLHLCVIMDLFSRKVVGWSLGRRNSAELVREALEEALYKRGYPQGVIFHSDRGSEYSSYLVQKKLRDNQFISSMSRRGNCWDNAPIESFFKTLKVELIKQIESRRLNLEEIRKECFKYIEGFYNTRRIHSALDNKSPERYEQ